ncbi:sulfatase-like hydrolase/transferase [Halalkalibaculum sp. DA384]|uniref:sulfatase-like hydrolase/transferase n=1 Tax=Halalkalibaculum sp. DA384 TaxID=3373606 RepID=UPI00375488C4
MYRHLFVNVLLATLLLINNPESGASASLFGDTNNQKEEPSHPNIVLIVVDDLGYGDLGIYGNNIHETPNIDQLGREGMVFTDFHSNAPVCSPTRAALMTGQYQQRSGVEYAIGFNQDIGMPLEKLTVAELLNDAGYKNGVFGKWHLGHVRNYGPNDQGFNQSIVSNNTPDYHTHVSRVGKYDWFKNHERFKEPGYLTNLVTKHSLDFIQDNRKNPFFLFISHIAVHFPFQGPEDPPHRKLGQIWHETKYGPLPESQYRRAYRDMLEAVDKSVGQVVDKLDDLGLREDTLIFLTSDNGTYSWVGSNYPLRGQKGDLFEGGHRIPAIANWPGFVPGGVISDATSITMDLTPTFLSIAGVTPPEHLTFDGLDLSQVLLENKDISDRTLYWRFNNFYDNTKAYAVRDKGWKYLVDEEKRYLFNLNQDLTESNNLIKSYPDKAKHLEELYEEWLNTIEK